MTTRAVTRLRFLQVLAGPSVHVQVGEEREWETGEALRLIAAGIAEPVGPDGGTWDLKVSPRDYLKRFPDGPNAKLALELIERR